MRKSGKFLALSLSVSVFGILASCQIPSPIKTDESPNPLASPSVSESALSKDPSKYDQACLTSLKSKSFTTNSFKLMDEREDSVCNAIIENGIFDTFSKDKQQETKDLSKDEREASIQASVVDKFCSEQIDQGAIDSEIKGEISYGIFSAEGSYSASEYKNQQNKLCKEYSKSDSRSEKQMIYRNMDTNLREAASSRTANPKVVDSWLQCVQGDFEIKRLREQNKLELIKAETDKQTKLLEITNKYLESKNEKDFQLALANIKEAKPGLIVELENTEKEYFNVKLKWRAFEGFDKSTLNSVFVSNALAVGDKEFEKCMIISTKTITQTYQKKNMTEGVQITINTSNGSYSTFLPGKEVTVPLIPKSITLTPLPPSELKINEGESKSLGLARVQYDSGDEDGNVTWESTDTAIAEISQSGQVTAKKQGSVTIIVKTNKKPEKVISIPVTVSKNPEMVNSVTINPPSTITPNVGDTINLTATVTMSDSTSNTNVTWSSSDTTIATVDSTGKVTTLKAGSVTITATSTKDNTKINTVTFNIIKQEKIYFISNRDASFQIYSMNTDGTNQIKITNSSENKHWPAISPDGTKIAYLSKSPSDIFVINSDGTGNPVNVSNDSKDNSPPQWSPDGTKIVYSSDNDIYLASVSDSTRVKITNTGSNSNPCFSADWKIFFASWRTGGWDIWSMNSDGNNQINLTGYSGMVDDYLALPSSDGKKVLITSGNRTGNNEIFKMNAGGSNVENITKNLMSDESPRWSPDGSKIVFSSNRDGNFEIYIMNNDGSNQTRMTNNHADEIEPTWSK